MQVIACQDFNFCSGRDAVNRKLWYNALRNYGCNCYPDNYDRVSPYSIPDRPLEQHMGKNGRYRNSDLKLDDLCREVNEAYTCLEQDVRDGTIVDGPFETLPRWGSVSCYRGTSFLFHWNGDKIVCGPADDPKYQSDPVSNRCPLVACEIEVKFAYAAVDFIMAAAGGPKEFREDNLSKYHAENLTDAEWDDMCVSNKGPVNRECCGEFPQRYPFNTNNKVCCGIDIEDLGTC